MQRFWTCNSVMPCRIQLLFLNTLKQIQARELSFPAVEQYPTGRLFQAPLSTYPMTYVLSYNFALTLPGVA